MLPVSHRGAQRTGAGRARTGLRPSQIRNSSSASGEDCRYVASSVGGAASPPAATARAAGDLPVPSATICARARLSPSHSTVGSSLLMAASRSASVMSASSAASAAAMACAAATKALWRSQVTCSPSHARAAAGFAAAAAAAPRPFGAVQCAALPRLSQVVFSWRIDSESLPAHDQFPAPNRIACSRPTRAYCATPPGAAAERAHSVWNAPALSTRSYVCAPKKSRCACVRLAGSRARRYWSR